MCLHLALASAHDCGAHGGRFVCPAARSEVGMTTRQVVFSQDELLADHPIAAPLTAHGRRCHGGFDEDGTYVSPRTRYRWPAIEAWEEQRLEQFGTPDPRRAARDVAGELPQRGPDEVPSARTG